MIRYLINKAFGKESSKEASSTKIASKIQKNLGNFSEFLSEKKELAQKEFYSIKEKSTENKFII